MTNVEGSNAVVIDSIITSLNTVCEQLNGDLPSRQIEHFDRDEFWNNFVGATSQVSHEATKFCMMFNNETQVPFVECKLLVNSLEVKCLTLLTAFFAFPKSKGKTLHRELKIFVHSILLAVKDLCTEAKHNRPQQLQSVGNVWGKCSLLENLPRDNRKAVMCVLKEQLVSVLDAIEEIEDVMRTQNEEIEEPPVPSLNGLSISMDDKWSDSDRQLLPSCLGLIKAHKACVTKTRSAISNYSIEESENLIDQLDVIWDICKSSSSLVDDFVLSLYPPMNHNEVKQQALSLAEHSRKLLDGAQRSDFCLPADTEWITFLRTAISHNYDKINERVIDV